MPSIRDLQARAWDLILPKWRLLLQWAEGLKIVTGPGIRITSTPNGTLVRAARQKTWTHPLAVSLSEGLVMVSAGFLNGERVRIGDVFVDGYAADGITPVPRPRLDITKQAPKTGSRSWVVLTPEGKVEHRTEHSLDVGHLALIIWQDGAPLRKIQITRHNQACGPGEGRVYFWAV